MVFRVKLQEFRRVTQLKCNLGLLPELVSILWEIKVIFIPDIGELVINVITDEDGLIYYIDCLKTFSLELWVLLETELKADLPSADRADVVPLH